MKDEIREILEYLKNNTFIPDETKRKYKILHRDEVNKLLDYITNLQNENEDYKSRVEKAIEKLKREYYINEHEWNDRTINEVLNILQNGDDEE